MSRLRTRFAALASGQANPVAARQGCSNQELEWLDGYQVDCWETSPDDGSESYSRPIAEPFGLLPVMRN